MTFSAMHCSKKKMVASSLQIFLLFAKSLFQSFLNLGIAKKTADCDPFRVLSEGALNGFMFDGSNKTNVIVTN